MKYSTEYLLTTSKRSVKLIETDDEKDSVIKNFTNFLNKNNFETYSRYTSEGAVVAERFNRAIGDLRKKLVFEKGRGKWIDGIHVVTKQNNFKTTLQLIQHQSKHLLKRMRIMFSKIYWN